MGRGRPLWLAGVLAAALLVSAPCAGAAVDPYRQVSLGLAQELIALFPAADGFVVSASGAEAYVDLSAKELLRPGMELEVYRREGEMVHPLTKQTLGASERHLGYLRLIDVRGTYSRGRLDAAGEAAKVVVGDRARISARRLRVLLHVAGTAAGIRVGSLAQALLARGEESGRFAMLDEPAWAAALAALHAPWEAVRADPSLLRRLGEATAADLLWLVRVDEAAARRVAIEVRSLHSGSSLAELSQRWPAEAPGAAGAPGEYTVRELAGPARSLAAGNVLGEGRLEVLLSDGARLALYRWEPQSLAWRWDEDGPRGRRILALDAADLDGDGRAEVLVTAAAGGRIISEVRRWQDGALRVVASIEGLYLLAAPRAGAPALLLGQRAGIGEVLSGRVEQYRLAGATVQAVPGTWLPAGVGVFGLALAPAAGPVALYALEGSGHIAGLTPEGAVLWRSAGRYGGHPVPLTARELFGPGLAEERAFAEKARVFRSRLLAEQLPVGVRLAVPRNVSEIPDLPVRPETAGQGAIALLDGAATSPEERRRSRAFDGYVADLARGDIDADGRPEILFVVSRFAGPLLGERATLVAWRPDLVQGGGRRGENSP